MTDFSKHLDEAIAGFAQTTDTDFQRGYAAALHEVRRVYIETLTKPQPVPAVRGFALALSSWVMAIVDMGETVPNASIRIMANAIAIHSINDIDSEFYEVRFVDGSSVTFSKED
jgi:hypothetical protein